jgi:6,7-dimethyl-8-ribityllumazine synthase
MPTMIHGAGNAADLRFAVIQSRFNEKVTKRLLEGALDALRAGGAKEDAIDVVSVPGAFEMPLIAARLARSRRYDAIICVGSVIRGETPHFEYISAVVSEGIARVSYDYGVPVIFGVLTCDTEEQADARSGGIPGPREKGMVPAESNHKGYAAGVTAIEMANLMKRLPPERRSTRRGSKNPRRQRPRKRIQ